MIKFMMIFLYTPYGGEFSGTARLFLILVESTDKGTLNLIDYSQGRKRRKRSVKRRKRDDE